MEENVKEAFLIILNFLASPVSTLVIQDSGLLSFLSIVHIGAPLVVNTPRVPTAESWLWHLDALWGSH